MAKKSEAPEGPVWTATVLTIFPEMFPGGLGRSLAGRALNAGLWTLETVDIRAFARDKHGTVDDTPFGGGAGMVIKPNIRSTRLNNTCDGFFPAKFFTSCRIQIEDKF